ncbi:TetR family transcriptional regulator [Streptosporangium sp. NPDC004379]|uniref:acyl-CoA-like ligand-binding transcription factor n=1 Tax=Streptosporangium sp. NPDC004379 TaxID=3366189 RepID=UPI00368B7AE6
MDTGKPERPGLRERKKQETRAALSWAAIRLVVERGLDAVRVEDIAAEVGVSPRTFNNYFSSKGEAIAARHLDRARRIAEELRARPESEPLWEAILNAVQTQFSPADMPADMSGGAAGGTRVDASGDMSGGAGDEVTGGRRAPDRRWIAGVQLMISEPSLQGEMFKANAAAEAELAAAIAERTGTDAVRDLYPRLVSGAVGAAVGLVMERWLRADPPVPFGPILRDALGQLAAGLPVPGRGETAGPRA